MAEIISGSHGGAENEENTSTSSEEVVEAVKAEDETVTPEPVAPVVEPAKEKTDDDDDDDDSDDDDSPITRRKARGLRSENRNLRVAKKELATENETLKTQLTELQAKVSGYEEKIAETSKVQMLSEVKAKFGLSDPQAKYLSGNTQEELEESAKQLLVDLGIKNPDYSRLKTGAGTGSASSVLSMSTEDILKQYSN